MPAARFDITARTLIDETTRRQTLSGLLGGAFAALGVGSWWGSEEAAARKKRKKKSCNRRKHGKKRKQGKKHKSCEKQGTALSPVCPAPSNATFVFQRQLGGCAQEMSEGSDTLPAFTRRRP